jgi:predicted NAD/FAD-binding protein
MEGFQYEIDTGFIVCNDRNYPHFLKFMDLARCPLAANGNEFQCPQ